METTSIGDFVPPDGITDTLTELVRVRAQQLIARAVQAELEGFMALFSTECPDAGHAAGVRNGPHSARPFQTGVGPVSVRIPKVRSKNGQPARFQSALVPPYVRKTKTLEAALPWLYLNGISSGEMGVALRGLLRSDTKGLSANTVLRLQRDWAKEYDGWREPKLDDEPLVCIWADGVHSGLCGENDKLCALMIVGVRARGKKRFLAIEDGVCEPNQSWREVLLSLKSPGMNAPELATGDGAMGFWAALHDIWQAETKGDAQKAFDLFIKVYEAKYPKAALCLQKDREELVASLNFPAQPRPALAKHPHQQSN